MKSWKNNNFYFLGCGHMSVAIIEGLILAGLPANKCTAMRRDISKLDQLKKQGVIIKNTVDNSIYTADIVFIGVKPNQINDLAKSYPFEFNKNTIIVSMLAGIKIATLQKLFSNACIARIMPNLACSVGKGVIGLYQEFCNDLPNALQQTFGSLGHLAVAEKEQHLDVITAISGSGIAYFYAFVVALQNAAYDCDMNKEQIADIINQTLIGSGKLLEHSTNNNAVSVAQDLVTDIAVPGGTTERALQVFLQNDIQGICSKALDIVIDKCNKISNI